MPLPLSIITKLLELKLQPAKTLPAPAERKKRLANNNLGIKEAFEEGSLGCVLMVGKWGMGMAVRVAGSEWLVRGLGF